MKLGDTFYYTMASNGRLTRTNDFDSSAPCHVSDKKCGPYQVAVWKCTNWDGEVEIGAGLKVRAKYPSDAAVLAALPR